MVKGKVRIGVCLVVILANILKSVTCERNVAESKPANQSSDNNGKWVASNVVDGCTKTNIQSDCCTHTQGNGPKTVWWQVDLEEPMTINSITIYYRDNYQLKLAGYHLYISNTTSTPQNGVLCYVDTSTNLADVQLTITHQCPYVGRYVTVYNYRNNPKRYSWYSDYAVLELCEVQVWGCPVGTYGNGNCDSVCSGNCYGGNCNATTGACFYCVPQKYGTMCEGDCSINCLNQICDRVSGHCNDCNPGWYGDMCNRRCSQNCSRKLCDRTTGNCIDCNQGWYGDRCNLRCSQNCNGTSCERITGNCFGCVSGTYGNICENSCSMNCSGMFCDRSSGSCLLGCVPKQYGETCDLSCSSNCNGTTCGRNDGHCLGCIAGKHGNTCDSNCPMNCKGMLCGKDTGNCIGCQNGRYGVTCSSTCPVTCEDFVCDQQTGHCLDCYPGKYGVVCGADCPDSCTDNICNKEDGQCLTQDSSNPDQQSSVDPNIIIAVLAVVCGLLVVAWIITYIYLRRNRDSGKNLPDKTTDQSGPDTGYTSIDRRDVEPAHVYEMVVT